MITAPTGVSQNVTGRISAIVVSGPMPGSTPIAVPMRQPRKQSPMFCHVSATPKPIIEVRQQVGHVRARPARAG